MDTALWANLQELFSKKLQLQGQIQQQQQAVESAKDDEMTGLQTTLDASKAELLSVFREEMKLQSQLVSCVQTTSKESAEENIMTESDVDSDSEESTSVRYTYKLTRPDKYRAGSNFADFCADFNEHIQLTRMKDANLSTYFINLVDAPTKKKLRKAVLTAAQRRDPKKFIPIFRRRMMPPHEAENLQMDFSDLTQKSEETIEDFSHRVEDIASLAFAEDSTANVNDQCFSAFVKGLSDTSLRIKLRESSIRTFPEAVEEAIRRHGIRIAEERRRTAVQEPVVVEDVFKIQQAAEPKHRNATSSSDHPKQLYHNQKDKRGFRQGGKSDGRNTVKLCYNCKQPNHIAKHCLLKSLNY